MYRNPDMTRMFLKAPGRKSRSNNFRGALRGPRGLGGAEKAPSPPVKVGLKKLLKIF